MPSLCYATSMDVSTFSADTIALAGLIIALFAWLRHDIKRLDSRIDGLDSRIDGLDSRIDGVAKSLGQRIDDLATEVKALSERVSRIEGLLEGLWRPRPWPDYPPEQDTTPPRTGTDG